MISIEAIRAVAAATPGVASVFAVSESGTTVSASIGVDPAAQAPETAAAVAAAIRALVPDAVVSVRISRVAAPSPIQSPPRA